MSEAKQTHEVFNQPPPLLGHNLFTTDAALRAAAEREGAGWATEELTHFGAIAGSAEAVTWGFQANQHPPVLRTHDRYGNRIDEVEFHPAWHEWLRLSVRHRLHCLPWVDPRPGSHVARAALVLMASQVEAGHCCPISMTWAAVPALRVQPELAAEWEPRICTTSYAARFCPAAEKTGVLLGMAMTEKQGGSDVRANTTRAVPAGRGGPGKEYRITGHKWFCSAPMSDAFLILAQAPTGLSCFLLPRWTPQGKRNHFFLQRLKDKLGNRSNASSEVEFDDAFAWLVGEEGRGLRTILAMVNCTRLDCATTSAGLMRQALAQAVHHCRHRAAFGRKLIEQPLMQNVLADLCLEVEAATALTLRLARAYDAPQADRRERSFARVATPLAKYWICKRAIAHVAEALECLGGNGYVEESILPRLYRESPLNSIWEGSGNVMCLDVRRALAREPEAAEALWTEMHVAASSEPRLGAWVAQLRQETHQADTEEAGARRLVERLALALQASLLVRWAPPALAEAFCASRLSGNGGRCFGTLPVGTDCGAILERAGV
jgi:putative acyl-CoA dehydrogenase